MPTLKTPPVGSLTPAQRRIWEGFLARHRAAGEEQHTATRKTWVDFRVAHDKTKHGWRPKGTVVEESGPKAASCGSAAHCETQGAAVGTAGTGDRSGFQSGALHENAHHALQCRGGGKFAGCEFSDLSASKDPKAVSFGIAVKDAVAAYKVPEHAVHQVLAQFGASPFSSPEANGAALGAIEDHEHRIQTAGTEQDVARAAMQVMTKLYGHVARSKNEAVARFDAMLETWNEEDHPRGPDGKFAASDSHAPVLNKDYFDAVGAATKSAKAYDAAAPERAKELPYKQAVAAHWSKLSAEERQAWRTKSLAGNKQLSGALYDHPEGVAGLAYDASLKAPAPSDKSVAAPVAAKNWMDVGADVRELTTWFENHTDGVEADPSKDRHGREAVQVYNYDGIIVPGARVDSRDRSQIGRVMTVTPTGASYDIAVYHAYDRDDPTMHKPVYELLRATTADLDAIQFPQDSDGMLTQMGRFMGKGKKHEAVARFDAMLETWNEEDHPRGSDGKFSGTGSGGDPNPRGQNMGSGGVGSGTTEGGEDNTGEPNPRSSRSTAYSAVTPPDQPKSAPTKLFHDPSESDPDGPLPGKALTTPPSRQKPVLTRSDAERSAMLDRAAEMARKYRNKPSRAARNEDVMNPTLTRFQQVLEGCGTSAAPPEEDEAKKRRMADLMRSQKAQVAESGCACSADEKKKCMTELMREGKTQLSESGGDPSRTCRAQVVLQQFVENCGTDNDEETEGKKKYAFMKESAVSRLREAMKKEGCTCDSGEAESAQEDSTEPAEESVSQTQSSGDDEVRRKKRAEAGAKSPGGLIRKGLPPAMATG